MSKTEELKSMVATMLRVSPSDIDLETSLKPLATSLGNAKLRLALKRLGLAWPARSVPTTFGALAEAVSGEKDVAVAPSRLNASPTISDSGNSVAGALSLGLRVGFDVEDIRSLPATLDFWEDEFYCSTFARSEIAYAILQAEPRIHFAGFWCAKEALRKCDSTFGVLNMAQTAVAHDATGRPYLTTETESGIERLGHALSISHTNEMAAAVVILAHESSSDKITPVQSAPVPTTQGKKTWRLAKLFPGN